MVVLLSLSNQKWIMTIANLLPRKESNFCYENLANHYIFTIFHDCFPALFSFSNFEIGCVTLAIYEFYRVPELRGPGNSI